MLSSSFEDYSSAMNRHMLTTMRSVTSIDTRWYGYTKMVLPTYYLSVWCEADVL